MAISDRYTGRTWYGTFVLNGGGTAVISGDYRAFTVTTNSEMLDSTAGSATNKEYLAGLIDGSADLEVMDTGATGSGSLLAKLVTAGAAGVLTWGNRGTATGNPKWVIPVIVAKADREEKYDSATMAKYTFQFNGAYTTNGDTGGVW